MPEVRLNGIEINYVDRGAGDVILLIHNVVADLTTFDDDMAVLEKHFRVIACDLRGHGATTHEDDQARAPSFYTFENIAEDITQLLDHLQVDRFTLVGQAYWGSSTAAHLFHRHPSRIDGIVLAACDLIAVDEGAEPYSGLGEQAIRNFERMIGLARKKGMMGVYEERLRSQTFWGSTVLRSPEILGRFEAMHRRTSAAAFANFPRFRRETLNEVLVKLEQHRTPLMMLMGVEDNHNEPMMANMRKLHPATHIALLAFCGHYPSARNPQDCSAAILNFTAGAIRSRQQWD